MHSNAIVGCIIVIPCYLTMHFIIFAVYWCITRISKNVLWKWFNLSYVWLYNVQSFAKINDIFIELKKLVQLKKVNIILYYQIDRSFDVSRNCLYNSSFIILLSVWINILLLFVNDNYFPQFCDEIWWRFICLFIGYLEIFSRYLKIDLHLWIIIAKNYYLFLFKIYARFKIEEISPF